MAAEWVRGGQQISDFDLVTFREIRQSSRGASLRAEDEMRRSRILNQELAHLIAWAHHKPDKIPDFTKSREQPAQMSEAAAAKLLFAHATQFTARLNAANRRKGTA